VPIYEYQCCKCSHQFEMIHGASNKEMKIVCPKCGDTDPQRVISGFSCGGSKSMETASGADCSPKPGRFS